MNEASQHLLERLDLYLDGALTPAEEKEFLAAVEKDPALSARLGQELSLDAALSRHFGRQPAKRFVRPRSRFGALGQAAAAVLLVALGGFAGTLLSRPSVPSMIDWTSPAVELSKGLRFAAAHGTDYRVLEREGQRSLYLQRGELVVQAEARGLIIETPNGRRLRVFGRGRVSRIEGSLDEPLLLVSMQSGEATWMDDPEADPVTQEEPTLASATGIETVGRAVGFGRAFAGDDELLVVPAAEYAYLQSLKSGEVAALRRRIRELESERLALRSQLSVRTEDQGALESELAEEVLQVGAQFLGTRGLRNRGALRELQGLAERMRRSGINPDEFIRRHFFGDAATLERRRIGLRLLGHFGPAMKGQPEYWDALQSDAPELRASAALALGQRGRLQPVALRALESLEKNDPAEAVRAAALIGLLRAGQLGADGWSRLAALRPALREGEEVRAAILGLYVDATPGQGRWPTDAVKLLSDILLDPMESEERQIILLLAATGPRNSLRFNPAEARALLSEVRLKAPSQKVRRIAADRLNRRN